MSYYSGHNNDGCVSLESLTGTKTLDARAEFIGTKRDQYTDDPRVVVYRLDGVLYWFQEDPSDGYRSGLDHARVASPDELPPGSMAEFSPIVVELRVRNERVDGPNSWYKHEDEVLYAVVERTGLVVFEVGTVEVDDYYPGFVSSWTPDGDAPKWLQAAVENE